MDARPYASPVPTATGHIGNLVQLTVRLKPATKARQGRNPATGEEITIAAKPASVDVRARALAKSRAALPSVRKARKRLGAYLAHARSYCGGPLPSVTVTEPAFPN